MKYAVIYDSETGNTEKLAATIYAAIDSEEKSFINLQTSSWIPEADVYFVGFPIHQNNCSMKIVDSLEEIENGKIALFATCGMQPADKYKQKLEDALSIWLPDDVEYLGMFLCQGRTTEIQKKQFCDANPEYREKLRKMLDDGDSHPDENDLADAVRFVKRMIQSQN